MTARALGAGASRVVALPSGGAVLVGRSGTSERGFYAAELTPSGSLDPSFGDRGIARVNVDSPPAIPLQVLRQPDGKLVVIVSGRQTTAFSFGQLVVVRLDADGSLDPTFGAGGIATALCLLVSSAGPLRAGTDAALVEALCGGGAKPDGIDDDGLPLWTAIVRGRTLAAEALVACGARVDNAVFAAALGDLRSVESWLPRDENPGTRRAPRSLKRIGASGPALDPAVVLEYALIYAAANGRLAAVEWLLRRSPDLSVTDPLFGSTALGAARYHRHDEVAAVLEAVGAG